MKKYLLLLATALFLATGCAKEFDDSEIWDAIEQLNGKVSTLETLLNAHNNDLSIKVVKPITGGFHIEFSDGSKADIVSGKDGKPGEKGPKGDQGLNGHDGAAGPQGPQGKPGDSMIKDVKVTEDYVEITIELGGKTQTISFPIYKGEVVEEESVALKLGYQDVTADYQVPSYMKIYRHSFALGKKPNAAVVVELKKGAKMTHLGATDIVAARETYGDEYPVLISGSTSMPTHTTVRNGEITIGQELTYPCFAQNADGSFEVIWQKTIGGKLQKINKDGSVLEDNWKPQALVDGFLMITWDGKAQTEAEACKPGGMTGTGWYGSTSCGRAAVGIRENGTLVLFVSDGQDGVNGGGLTMDELSQHMADLQCKAAVCLEGSSSPDLIITKVDMVKNKNRFKVDGTPTGKAGKVFQPLPAFK